MNKTTNILLIITIFIMGVLAHGCGTMTAGSLANIINSECPITLKYGLVMESVTSESNNVIAHVSMDFDQLVLSAIQKLGFNVENLDGVPDAIKEKAKQGLAVTSPAWAITVKPSIIESMQDAAKTDENVKNLITVCKTTGVNMVYRFNLPDSTTQDITIEPKDWE